MPKVSVVLAATLLACSLPGVAQTNDDWFGYYGIARGKDLAGLTVVSPNLDQVIADHLQPWAKARMLATDGVADDDGSVCQPSGLFRFPVFAGSFLWLPGSDKIVIVYGMQALNTAGVQRVYLNRPHPKSLLPTWNGDSVGHWEGDTLVVDTIGFNDKSWLQPAMEWHTEEAHLIQRIRRVRDGAFIEVVGVVEDRQALTSAYTYTRYYKKTSDYMREDVCNDQIEMWKDWKNKAVKRQLDQAQQVR